MKYVFNESSRETLNTPFISNALCLQVLQVSVIQKGPYVHIYKLVY
jgi:hypothetical protein